jgi:four helix bundle protein
MRDFRKLKVWGRSHELTLRVYALSRGFPKEELFGLTGQARRSAASIPANICEGCGRLSGADLRRFLGIAMGSASELEYHLLLARDLGYTNPADHHEVTQSIAEVKKMLTALIQKLTADS